MEMNVVTRKTASSSPPSCKWTYDVFLSFRGEDVRMNFLGFLYDALEKMGIYTFKDDKELQKGSEISPALLKAIEQSRFAIVVFSKNYASSRWCLDELVKIIECKNVLGQTVIPVFYHVDPSAVRKQTQSFQEAFEKHEANVQDKEKIQRWRKALVRAANVSGWDVPNTTNGDESGCVQQIVRDISKKLHDRVLIAKEDLVGMKARMKQVISLLDLGVNGVRFVGIWGMSGIGKSTIVRAVLSSISNQFEGVSFLHEIGSRLQEQAQKKNVLTHLQKKVLSDILGTSDWGRDETELAIRLRSKRVLLVLDDVDDGEQLDALAGNPEWFGPGSRIIITTRNKRLLNKHGVDGTYEVNKMSTEEGVELFSRHAFKRELPHEDFADLTHQIIHYAGGLPLALKILGSFLYDRNMAEWESEVNRLKSMPEDKILDKLKVGLNGLEDIEKEIFLDIACFLHGKKKDTVIRMLESFGFHPVIGMSVLIERCLVTVSSGRVEMHQLIREIGWRIVREEALKEPGRRSRVSIAKDICHLLARDMVTENIEGMWLHLSVPTKVTVKKDTFKKMNKLRLLKLKNADLCQVQDHIPDSIRWLDWNQCPLERLPAHFEAKELVGLKMKHSRIIQLWKGFKKLENLKFMNLGQSQKLKKTPDLSGTPNLETLILEGCTRLEEIHPSAGTLKQLRVFNLKGCKNLKSLPKNIQLEKLEVFILSGCSKLEKLPEELGNMKRLQELQCDETAILQPPSSIALLKNLKVLSFRGCKAGAASGTSSSWFLPKKHQTSVISSLSGLTSLIKLDLSNCNMLDEEFPCDLEPFSLMEELNISRNNFVSINGAGIKSLSRLKILGIAGCKRLELLPELPQCIEQVYADNCTSLHVNTDNLSMTEKLFSLSLGNCNQLLENQDDSSPIDGILQSLLKGHSIVNDNFIVCLPGKDLPNWFVNQIAEPSIFVELPPNWYRTGFMGFTIGVITDFISQPLSLMREIEGFSESSLGIPSIALLFTVIIKDGQQLAWIENDLRVGAESAFSNMDNLCSCYVSFNQFWSRCGDLVKNPNDLIYIGVYVCDLKPKAMGIRLVYEDDIIEDEERSESPENKMLRYFHSGVNPFHINVIVGTGV